MTGSGAGSERGDAANPIRVLQSFPGGGPNTNPYLLQLVDSLPADVRVQTFSWRAALLGAYDVLHVHWPDRLTRGATPARTLLRRALLTCLLLRLRLTRRALVRTLHNLDSHERGDRWERRLLRAVDRRTTLRIRLNPHTPVPDGAPVRLIPHGHYRDWYRDVSATTPEPRRVLFFGLLRPYKGIEELVEAFEALDDPSARLRVVGKPDSATLTEVLTGAEARDPRITTRLGYVPDEILAEEVQRSQLVVLPYRALHNSGAALLALSLDRPVLLPSNDVSGELTAEVGAEWVHTYRPPLTADDIRAALDGGTPSEARPSFAGREWPEIGALHAEAYSAAASLARNAR